MYQVKRAAIQVNSWLTRSMVKECSSGITATATKESIRMTSEMGTGRCSGMILLTIKENGNVASEAASASIFSQMERSELDSSSKINLPVR